MSRKNDRRHAVRLIFELGFLDADEVTPEKYFASFEGVNDEGEQLFKQDRIKIDKMFVTNAYNGVKSRLTEIDGVIGECADGWTVERIAKPDLAVLRLGVYETLFGGDTPASVALDEAAAAARFFGGKDAAAFVYGVLSSAQEKFSQESESEPNSE